MDTQAARAGTGGTWQLQGDTGLAALSDYLRGDSVLIHVSLAIGDGTATVWGCDLTDGYIRINADYTT